MKGENGIAQMENEFESVQKSRMAGGRAFAAFFPRFPFPTVQADAQIHFAGK